jgi:hypothetical protein
MGNDDGKLDPLHTQILEKLEEGRATPKYIADHVGESRQLISNRLRDLRMTGHVTKVHTGLYELADDDWRDDAEETVGVDIRAAVEGADWDGSNYARTQSRVDALVEVLEYLRDEQKAKTPELVSMLDECLGDDSNNQRLLSDICKSLEIVESPPSGSNVYRWVGE